MLTCTSCSAFAPDGARFCPGCGALLENEIAREGDPVLRDIEITKFRVS